MTADLLLRTATHFEPHPENTLDRDLDAAVDRLAAEFRHRLGRRSIRRVVDAAHADLSGVPAGAVPELVERLARHRLTGA